MEKARSLGVNLGEVRDELREAVKNLSKYPYLEPEALKAMSEWVYVKQEIVKETLEAIAEKAKEYGLRLRAVLFPHHWRGS